MVERIILPEKLDLESIKITLAALEAATFNESKVIVFQGQGDIFCLGMSFENLLCNDSAGSIPLSIDLFDKLLRTIYFSKKPTIALVQGTALGGGAGIAAACDLIIAENNARFGFSESLFGLLPGMILAFLLYRISPQQAKRLILLANTITAQQALEIGLVDEKVDAFQLEACLQSKMKHLSRINPEVVFKIKEMIAEGVHLSLESFLENGRKALIKSLSDTKVINNIRDYIEYGMTPWEETSKTRDEIHDS
jgi:enoyl-CoA hydratase/carnithine racemase